MALIAPPPNTKPISFSTLQYPKLFKPGRTLTCKSSGHSNDTNISFVHNCAGFGNGRSSITYCERVRRIIRAASISVSESGGEESSFGKILLSDVVVKRRRKVYWGRKWSSMDVATFTVVGAMHLLCLFAPFVFNWGAFWVAVGLYLVTGLLGITLSYHRNLSHRSFKLPKWLEYSFAYCGAQALQCGSPNNASDLEKQPFYKFLERTYAMHPVALGLLLYVLGGFPFIVWGMGVRIVWVYHITWLVNSACHVWGKQAWNTGDLSRNNWWVAVLAFGEGWHNNHHAFEYSARHGLEWWQLDMTWNVVRFLQAIGLATDVKLPTENQKRRVALAGTSNTNTE